jgi:hypothetical protein
MELIIQDGYANLEGQGPLANIGRAIFRKIFGKKTKKKSDGPQPFMTKTDVVYTGEVTEDDYKEILKDIERMQKAALTFYKKHPFFEVPKRELKKSTTGDIHGVSGMAEKCKDVAAWFDINLDIAAMKKKFAEKNPDKEFTDETIWQMGEAAMLEFLNAIKVSGWSQKDLPINHDNPSYGDYWIGYSVNKPTYLTLEKDGKVFAILTLLNDHKFRIGPGNVIIFGEEKKEDKSTEGLGILEALRDTMAEVDDPSALVEFAKKDITLNRLLNDMSIEEACVELEGILDSILGKNPVN